MEDWSISTNWLCCAKSYHY